MKPVRRWPLIRLLVRSAVCILVAVWAASGLPVWVTVVVVLAVITVRLIWARQR